MEASTKNSTPFFSVVTVCFNAKETIAQTIDSVRLQRGVSIQYIIVDGGSTDGTLDIINSFSDQIDVIISGPDRGVYDAMQKGLQVSRGTYTGFLNADDYFAGPDVLLKMAAALSGGVCLGVSGVVQQVNGSGTVIRTIGRDPLDLNELLWGKFPPHPATYLVTELMKKAGGFKHHYKIAGDFDLLIRMLKNSPLPLAHLNQPIVKMRMGGASTMGFSAYRISSKELLAALRNAGYPANALKVHGRMLKKLPELFRGRPLQQA
jgi:glycosyltransferase involved in cell wall biosynthesis